MERPVVFPLLLVSVAPLHVGRAAADPRRADAANFSALFARPFWRWFGNTLLIAGTAAVLNVVLCALGAYAFSRLRFSGRRAGLLTVLLVQMFPQLLAMVPCSC